MAGGFRKLNDIVFGKGGDTELLLDLYLPNYPVRAVPIILYIRGGGWAALDKSWCPYPMRLLEKADIACSPILSLDEVIQDRHFNAREMLVEAEHPKLGKIKMVGVVPKLSETPGDVKTAGPLLGQHNEEVYSNMLEYSAEKIVDLKGEGVI